MKTNFPTLYHNGKKDVIYSWDIHVEGNVITISYGQKEGKKTVTTEAIKGKNIGRANETTPEEQAIKEASAHWLNKKERKYREVLEDAKENELNTLPMLAKEFTAREKKIVYPVYVQPKLNGVRALARWVGNKVVLTSRQGKVWEHVPHINEALENILPNNDVFDGELYVHGLNLQEITRLVKKQRPESKSVEFNVYDCPVIFSKTSVNYKGRLEYLEEIFKDGFHPHDNKVKLVHTDEVHSKQSMLELYSYHIAFGYEGVMIRIPDSLYEFAHRSNGLLKYKEFKDAEYKIVGYKSGNGSYENCIVFRCVTPENKEFDVNMKATIAEKEEMLKEAESYIGKFITVKYFDLTEDKIPQFPVGLAIRSEEDLPNG